mgnify:FL=1|jgi:hypothetical protein|tara:strand:- start:97 stop:300 length:204 start_codon:yes stop_codon:yes gene_type:complete
MSLDFVYDLKDNLEDQGYDYFIVTIKRSGEKNADRSNVFYRLTDEEAVESLKQILKRIGIKEGKRNE